MIGFRIYFEGTTEIIYKREGARADSSIFGQSDWDRAASH